MWALWILLACYVAVAAGVVAMHHGCRRRGVLSECACRHQVAGDLYLVATELLANGQDEAADAVAELAGWRAAQAEEFTRLHGLDREVAR